jgi:THAP domain-containing protein 4
MSLSKVPVHKCLEKLQWLLGLWRSESATIQLNGKIYSYLSELKCEHVGQPNFSLHINAFNVQPMNNETLPSSWTNVNELKAFHREMGFVRVNPNDILANEISYLNVQNVGLAHIEEGTMENKRFQVETKSIERSCFNKDPSVRVLRREYSLDESDAHILHEKVFMSTSRMNDDEPPFEHLTVRYRKVSDE